MNFFLKKIFVIFLFMVYICSIVTNKCKTMNTISINTQLYDFAASYAMENNISITQLVEDFLSGLLKKVKAKKSSKNYVMKEVSELSPIVKQLAGIAKSNGNTSDSEDLNGIDAKTEYLNEKFLR